MIFWILMKTLGFDDFRPPESVISRVTTAVYGDLGNPRVWMYCLGHSGIMGI